MMGQLDSLMWSGTLKQILIVVTNGFMSL